MVAESGFTRLPADFVDRLADLMCTVRSAQLMFRPEAEDDRLARIVRLAVGQTGAEFGALLLVSEARGDLQVVAATGEHKAALEGAFVARTGLAGFAIDDGSPVAIADVSDDQRALDEIESLCGLRSTNVLAVPLLIHGKASGALEMRNSPAAKGFGPGDIELASEFAYLAAAAVEEHRGERFLLALFEAALPDALDPRKGPRSLDDELTRWLAELRQTPAWRAQIDLLAQVRELCFHGQDSVRLARSLLDAVIAREASRRVDLDDGVS